MSPGSTPPTPSGAPTDAQIQQVITNLGNIQRWNDYVYDQSDFSLFSNAFGLLSYNDNNDLGLAVGLSVMAGVCSAIGGFGGVAGAFFGAFIPGMISYWATKPPPDLTQTFGSLEMRLSQTSEAFDEQLAGYAADVEGSWNQSFPYAGTTGTVADLANITFPVETDPAFFPLVDAGKVALDQWIWKAVLKEKYVVTAFTHPSVFMDIAGASEGVPPVSAAQAYYQKNPAYYVQWFWEPPQTVPVPGIGPVAGVGEWGFNAWNIGTGVNTGFNEGLPFTKDGGMSVPACQYLFIDSTPGTTINPKGLFTREDVFNNLGLNTASHDSERRSQSDLPETPAPDSRRATSWPHSRGHTRRPGGCRRGARRATVARSAAAG